MPLSTTAHLTGPLYFISLLSALSVAAIGLTFLLGGPASGYSIFGIPLFTSPTSSLWPVAPSLLGTSSSTIASKLTASGSSFASGSAPSSAEANAAYVAIIGMRDLTLAFVSLCFVLLRDRRGAGVAMSGGIFATAADACVMARYSEDPVVFIGGHLVTCVPLIALVAVLLGGGGNAAGRKVKV